MNSRLNFGKFGFKPGLRCILIEGPVCPFWVSLEREGQNYLALNTTTLPYSNALG